MMTLLLADKSAVIKIKTIMSFMNENLNPPCNSRLATFCELNFEAYRKRVSSCLETFVRPKWTLSQMFEVLFPIPLLMSPKSFWRERGEKSPVGGPEGPVEVGDVCETEAVTKADVEDKDEDVDVVGGVDEVGVFGCESEGFTISEILRRKRFAKKNVSEGVVDIVHCPQCEFSYLHLPLTFFLEFLCWPVIEYY